MVKRIIFSLDTAYQILERVRSKIFPAFRYFCLVLCVFFVNGFFPWSGKGPAKLTAFKRPLY